MNLNGWTADFVCTFLLVFILCHIHLFCFDFCCLLYVNKSVCLFCGCIFSFVVFIWFLLHFIQEIFFPHKFDIVMLWFLPDWNSTRKVQCRYCKAHITLNIQTNLDQCGILNWVKNHLFCTNNDEKNTYDNKNKTKIYQTNVKITLNQILSYQNSTRVFAHDVFLMKCPCLSYVNTPSNCVPNKYWNSILLTK